MTSTNGHAPATQPKLEVSGLVAAAVCGVGVLLVLIGRVASWKGFTANDNDTSALGAVAALMALIGFVITVGVTIALFLRSRRAAGLTPNLRVLLGFLVAVIVLAVLFNVGVFG